MGVMPRTKKFRVAAIFYSGMYEYDATYVYTMMDVAQDYFQTAGKVSAIEVKVEDAERADRITPLVVAAVAREDLRVRDWRDINRNLFSALKLERIATFIILSVAIMVASFCIVCTLLLMVTEKGKEIAILKAIGASDGAILRTFIIEGMVIGGIGTVFGVVTGLAVCTGLSWFGLRLDPAPSLAVSRCERLGFVPGSLSQHVVRAVDGDPMEPRPEARPGFEPPELPVGL